jgi:hypothetical protein
MPKYQSNSQASLFAFSPVRWREEQPFRLKFKNKMKKNAPFRIKSHGRYTLLHDDLCDDHRDDLCDDLCDGHPQGPDVRKRQSIVGKKQHNDWNETTTATCRLKLWWELFHLFFNRVYE